MFTRLSIKTRLAVAMLLLSLLLLVVGSVGIAGMNASNAVSRESYAEQLPGALAIGDTQIYTLRQRVTLDRALLSDDQKAVDQLLALAAQVNERANQAWSGYIALPKSQEEQRLARRGRTAP